MLTYLINVTEDMLALSLVIGMMLAFLDTYCMGSGKVIGRIGLLIGVIAAGVRLTLKALTENTAALPSVSINAPKNVIGTNTVDCMKSGLVFGAAAMLDGLIDQISSELGAFPTVVATGGLSKEIVTHCHHDIIYNENLLLEGLREIYERNK